MLYYEVIFLIISTTKLITNQLTAIEIIHIAAIFTPWVPFLYLVSSQAAVTARNQ